MDLTFGVAVYGGGPWEDELVMRPQTCCCAQFSVRPGVKSRVPSPVLPGPSLVQTSLSGPLFSPLCKEADTAILLVLPKSKSC